MWRYRSDRYFSVSTVETASACDFASGHSGAGNTGSAILGDWLQPRRLGTWTFVRGMDSKGISTMNRLLERVTIDPAVCGGKPCIKGTRIWVSLILDFLADGMIEAELLAEYPQLVHEDVLAAIAYGAEAARERVVPVPTDRVA
jgi:uncharacterized protein (DUF433 family)